MNRLPRLVASDISGTLLENVKYGIPGFTTRVLNSLVQKGIPVALLTGFNYKTTLKCAKELDDRIFLLPQNGVICSRAGQVLWEYEISRKEVEEIINFLSDRKFPIILFFGGKGGFKNYYLGPTGFTLPGPFSKIDKINDLSNITGISTLVPNDIARSVKGKLARVINGRYQLIYVRKKNNSWLEILQNRVRKDLGLQQLCNELVIDPADVVYFGDNFNDFEALKLVGRPMVMENSVPELLKEFKETVQNVRQQGVGHYLNQLFDLGIRRNT